MVASVNVGLLRCWTSGVRQSSIFSEDNYSETTYSPVL